MAKFTIDDLKLITEQSFAAFSQEEVAEEAAWRWLERSGYVPTPQLLFAMKQLIREQMLGG
jgi:hypothetical protein